MKAFKFYRVHVKDPQDGGTSHGYIWASDMRSMLKLIRAAERNGLTHDDIDEIQIEPLKYKILIALNNYAGHADNG